MNFGTWPARTRITHLPEVALVTKLHDTLMRNTGLVFPAFQSFIIAVVNGHKQSLSGEFPYFGEKFPGPAYCFFL